MTILEEGRKKFPDESGLCSLRNQPLPKQGKLDILVEKLETSHSKRTGQCIRLYYAWQCL